MDACTYVIFGSNRESDQRKTDAGIVPVEANNRFVKDTVIVASGRSPWNRKRSIEEAEGILEDLPKLRRYRLVTI